MSSVDSAPPSDQLRQLAELHSLQLSFYDIEGTRHDAATGPLKMMLAALGVDVDSEQDVAERLREGWIARWSRPLEPVTVAWEGEDNAALLRLPAHLEGSEITCELTMEDGGKDSARFAVSDLPTFEVADFGGDLRFLLKKFGLPPLPAGYHRLTVRAGESEHAATIISAPTRCYSPEESRQWGVFAPLYGCHSAGSWGGGSIADLRRLDDWVSSLGGSLVATLPMFAAFLDRPYEPSPYAPASRLFWNEIYLDLEAVAELAPSGAGDLVRSSAFREEIERLRSLRYVDHASKMRLMRQALEMMSDHFWSDASGGERREELQSFVRERPDVEDYARFRATMEKQGKGWHEWPESWTSGAIPEEAWDERNARYHVYVQWLADQQLRDFSEEARRAGGGLYLDFPLGVHPDGYDVWRERDTWIRSASVGAPPDSVSTKGQNWGFPPLHPERIRDEGYSYLIEAIRHPLRRAATLRIDHVMTLHRLFCIPLGHDGDEGVYVRYREDEMFAILCLESQRYRATIVGEDLGTVPDIVRERMNRHGVKRMYVLQYELAPDREPPIRPVPEGIVASVNTHDMPTFKAFAEALDVDDRIELGLMDEAEAKERRESRRQLAARAEDHLRQQGWIPEGSAGTAALLEGALSFLAASDAQFVIVNLEDLWGETLPQNVPGTSEERPNWTRKLTRSLEQIETSAEIGQQLRALDRLRKREGRADG